MAGPGALQEGLRPRHRSRSGIAWAPRSATARFDAGLGLGLDDARDWRRCSASFQRIRRRRLTAARRRAWRRTRLCDARP